MITIYTMRICVEGMTGKEKPISVEAIAIWRGC